MADHIEVPQRVETETGEHAAVTATSTTNEGRER